MGKQTIKNKFKSNDIQQFLTDYHGMSLAPSRNDDLVLIGIFTFSANFQTGNSLVDSYNLRIVVPSLFPKEIPIVTELDRKIPRDNKHHINETDDTLCLGSPLRLLFKLSKNPSLTGFGENILVPYLYAISHQRLYGGKLPADELAHGAEGIINDYCDLLKLKTPEQIRSALKLLGTKRRLANKKPCPCNCGSRYGKCAYRFILEKYRHIANRRLFIEQIVRIGK
jgi:hypothetical protein